MNGSLRVKNPWLLKVVEGNQLEFTWLATNFSLASISTNVHFFPETMLMLSIQMNINDLFMNTPTNVK